MSSPSVTIVLPVHKEEDYIDKAMDNIIGQTFNDFNAYIVLTESSQYSIQLVDGLANEYSYIDYEVIDDSLTSAQSRNRGIEWSDADYICCYDADDLMDPKRVATQYLRMESQGYDLTGQHLDYTDIRVVGGDNIDGKKPQSGSIQKFTEEEVGIDDPEDWAKRITMVHNSMMFKNDGIRYREKFKHNAPFDLMLKLITEGRDVGFMPMKLCTKVKRPDSKSNSYPRLNGKYGRLARLFFRDRLRTGDDQYEDEDLWDMFKNLPPHFS